MNFQDIANKVMQLGFPILGAAIAGPAGAATAMMIAKQFGVDSTPDDIMNAISTPEAKTKLSELDIELQKVNQLDRDSARKMHVAVPLDKTPQVLAYLIVGGFLASIGCLFVDSSMTENTKQVLMILLGVLGAKCGSIIDFYFGSSSSNK